MQKPQTLKNMLCRGGGGGGCPTNVKTENAYTTPSATLPTVLVIYTTPVRNNNRKGRVRDMIWDVFTAPPGQPRAQTRYQI